MRRPAILTFVGCYLPGFKGGGPIRTVANLVDRLHDTFAFRIVTDDRDHGDDQPYADIELDQWLPVGKAKVCYAPRRRQTLRGVTDLIRRTPHDVMYLNSLFSPRFTLLPLVVRRLGLAPRRPTVLAPRGELGEGALALKSPKKRVFLAVAGLVGLYKGVIWQASSSHEARRIMEVMKASQDTVFVAPNLPAPLQDGIPARHSSGVGRPTLMFVSRIVRMKNLDFAVRVLMQVSVPIDFLIYGTIEDPAYWAECEKLIATVPSHIRISYEGELPHDRVRDALGHADLFLLPTRGENYGHAIIEALGAGLPVLISDQTPWGEVQERGAGWVLALDNIDSWVTVINEWAAEPSDVRASRSRRAYEYALEVSLVHDAVEANVRMFQAALASSTTDEMGLPSA